MSAAPAKAANNSSAEISVLLGITQAVAYGVLYYAFGPLAPQMAADTGFSLPTIFGLFSLALAGSGAIAAHAGRLMDSHSPALIMAAGSLMSAFSLLVWALTPGKTAFVLALMAVQFTSILVLYEASFVTAARLVPVVAARKTITGITLIAGFSSTLFWPLTQWLGSELGWRGTYLVYAALQLAICLPLHLVIWKRHAPVAARVSADRTVGDETGAVGDPKLRRLLLWLLLAGFSAQSFVLGGVHLHLIGILGALGLESSAGLVGAMLGPMQVAARLIELAGANRYSVKPAIVFCALSLPVALAILLAGAPGFLPALAFAVIFGAGQGLTFVVRAILPLQIFGRHGYGGLTGRLNAKRLYFAAIAPFVVALLFERFGVLFAVGALLAVAALGGVAVLFATALAANHATQPGKAD